MIRVVPAKTLPCCSTRTEPVPKYSPHHELSNGTGFIFISPKLPDLGNSSACIEKRKCDQSDVGDMKSSPADMSFQNVFQLLDLYKSRTIV